jgi:hypothetical protein
MGASGDQISSQEVQLYLYFAAHPESWVSNRDAAAATKLNGNTVKLHTRVFCRRGLLDKILVHPGFRYRYKTGGDEAYETRLREAAEAFNFGTASSGEI